MKFLVDSVVKSPIHRSRHSCLLRRWFSATPRHTNCKVENLHKTQRLGKSGTGLIGVESCGGEYPLGLQHMHYFEDGSYKGVQLRLDDDKYIPVIKN